MLKLIKLSNILLWSVVAHTCDYVPVTNLTCNTLICEKKALYHDGKRKDSEQTGKREISTSL